MSVEITFQPAGLSGLVAEGIYISAAAHRMGVTMSLDCKGVGECTTCQISILSGAELLSTPTEVENRILGVERLAQQQRLACQARLERSGELIVHVSPETEKAAYKPGETAGMRKEFGELPLNKKIKTRVQLEAITMYEALNAVIDKPLAMGEKVFDRIFFRTAKTGPGKKAGK